MRIVSGCTRPTTVTQRKVITVPHELNNGRSESDGPRGCLHNPMTTLALCEVSDEIQRLENISRNIGDAPMSTRKSPG
jgi:hypothetical protein